MQQGETTTASWIFTFVGLLALLASIGLAMHAQSFIKHAVRCTGTITAMVEHIPDHNSRDRDRSPSYSPTFQFSDESGLQHTIESSLSSYPPAHRVGDIVSVIYNRTEPDKARIDSFFYLWGMPVISGLLGFIFLLAGLSRRGS